MNARSFRLVSVYMALTLLLIGGHAPSTSATAPDGDVLAKWWYNNLPAKACPGTTDTSCHYSSPVLADLTGDGRPEIITATNNGHVVVIRNNTTASGDRPALLWDVDVAPFFGMAAGTQEIASSPAVADLDADGQPEIAVGAGSIYSDRCTQGGVVVLDKNGRLKPGWPRFSVDHIAPTGCKDTVFATPALGDLDKDGKLEVVVGSFDMRVYAWRFDGTPVPGFPPDSALAGPFPTDPEYRGKLGDTIWSSPALADLDRDGYLEVIIGTDEGNRYENDYWQCPYTLPPGWRPGYCGGSLYVFDRFGKIRPGFPKYILEVITSSPAVADLNGDGWLDMVVGTGNFYYQFSPDHPTYGYRFYAWDRNGNDLPGWAGGKAVGGPVPMSPAVGDIDGDGQPEVVVATWQERKLYAWRANGTMVPGFPMTPTDERGQAIATYDAGYGIVLADYNGDGKMEIFINMGWVVDVINGAGQQLTAPSFPSAAPIFQSNGSLINNPAVGDIDGDGKLELVVNNTRLTVWDLGQSTNTRADWPVFRRNAARTGVVPIAPLPPKAYLPLVIR